MGLLSRIVLLFVFLIVAKLTKSEKLHQEEYNGSFLRGLADQNGKFHERKFNGDIIKVLALQVAPAFTYGKQPDGSYAFGGIVYDLLKDAQNYLDIKYEFIIIDEALIKKYGRTGTFLKYLDDKEVDLVPYTFDQVSFHLKHMEVAPVLWIESMVMIQPWPEEQSRFLVTIRPFEWKVWLSFIAVTAIFILATAGFVIILRKGQYNQSVGETIYHQFEYVLTIITSQGNHVSSQFGTTFKFMVGIWLLSMIVLIYAYTGVMTALLSVPKLESTPKNLEEVVLQGRTLSALRGASFSAIILNATEGYEKQIGDQFRKDSSLWVKDLEDGLQTVIQRKCSFVGSSSSLKVITYQDKKANGYCRITISPELSSLKPLKFQLGFPIGSLYAPAFSEYTLRMTAAGIVEHLKKKHIPPNDKCRTDAPHPTTKNKPFSLHELVSAFLIWGIGISLSILAFIFEIIVNTFSRRSCGYSMLVHADFLR